MKNQRVKQTVDSRGKDFLTEAEMKRFLEAARQSRHGVRDHLMMLMAYRHGLRVSELIDIRLKDLDLEIARLYVRRKKGSLSTHQPIEGPAQPSSTAMTSKPDQEFDSMLKARRSNLPPLDNSLLPDRRKMANGRRETETTLIAQDLVMPHVIERFDRSSVVLRGDDNKIESFNIIGPYSTVIGDDQPTFRWTVLAGATSYTVSVYDANLNLIRASEPLTELHWTLPSHLERGGVYTWVVTALKDGKEILSPTLPARAEFKIIEKPALDKLNRRIKHIRSAVARGVLYAQAGLLDQAEQELRAHLALHPSDESAKNLHRTIKSWREP